MCGEVFPLMQALMSTEETASPAFSPATPTAELTRPPALILTGEWVRDMSCFSRENSRGRGAPGAQEGPGAAGSISHLPGCTPCSCALPCTSTEPSQPLLIHPLTPSCPSSAQHHISDFTSFLALLTEMEQAIPALSQTSSFCASNVLRFRLQREICLLSFLIMENKRGQDALY